MTLLLALAMTLAPVGDIGPAVPRPATHHHRAKPGHHLRGIASWGNGWQGVVTRLPRGTRISVCGRLGCWSGHSVGYGPARWTGRIADLSAPVFREICGPLSKGLCNVTLSWP